MSKKIMCLLLVCLMVFGLLPSDALADYESGRTENRLERSVSYETLPEGKTETIAVLQGGGDSGSETAEVNVLLCGEPCGEFLVELHDSEGYADSAWVDADGCFRIDKSLAETTGLLLVGDAGRYDSVQDRMHHIIFVEALGQPVEGVYTVNLDPWAITMVTEGVDDAHCPGKLIFSADNRSGLLDTYGISMNTLEDGNILLVSSSVPLTVRAIGTACLYQKTFPMTADAEWDFSDELQGSATLRLNTSPEDTGSTTAVIGIFAGEDAVCLSAAPSADFTITPGTYPLSGIAADKDGHAVLVRLGNVSLTASQETVYTLGWPLTGSIGFTNAVVRENSSATALLSIKDCEARPVSAFGYASLYEGGNSFYTKDMMGVSVRLDGTFVNNFTYSAAPDADGIFRIPIRTNDLSGAGTYDVTIPEDIVPLDASAQLQVKPEEERSPVRVEVKLVDSYGEECSYPDLFVLLQDENGEDIIRQSRTDYSAYTVAYSTLPAGAKYDAVLSSSGYLCRMEIDLTAAEAGDMVALTVEVDSTWICKEFAVENSDANMRLYRLPLFPEQTEEKTTIQNGIFDSILTKGFGKSCIEMLFEEYDYSSKSGSSVFYVVEAETDFSDGETALTLNFDVIPGAATEKDTYAAGEPVQVFYDFRDCYGNRFLDIRRSAEKYKLKSEVSVMSLVDDLYSGGWGMELAPADIRMVLTDGGETLIERAPDGELTYETFTGLEKGTYTVFALCGEEQSEGLTFTVGETTDSMPSTLTYQKSPRKLTASAQNDGKILLNWEAPLGGCAGYILYADGEEIGSFGSEVTSFTHCPAQEQDYYSYDLYALNEENVRSIPRSAGVRAAASADTQAPSVPGNVALRNDGYAIEVTWNRASDNVGVSNYILSVNGEDRAVCYARRYSIGRILPETEYTVTVRAVDGAGNESAESAPVTVTTEEGTRAAFTALNYEQNRLGLMTGNELELRSIATGDVTAMYALIASDDFAEPVTVPLSLCGEEWVGSHIFTEAEFFQTISAVSLKAYTNETDFVSAVWADVPIEKAKNTTVSFEKPGDFGGLDLAECTMTLASSALGYAISRQVENWDSELYLALPAADDYSLTVTGADGNLLYHAEIGTPGNTIAVPSPDCALIRVSAGSHPELSGMEVLLYDRDGQSILASGTVGADGFVYYADGTKRILMEHTEVTARYKVVTQAFTTPDGKTFLPAAEQTVSYSGGIDCFDVTVSPRELRSGTVSVTVENAGRQPLSGIPVTIVSDLMTVTVLSGADGVATAEMQYTGSYANFMASTEEIKLENGGFYAPASTSASAGNYNPLRLTEYHTDGRLHFDLTVNEGGVERLYSASSLADAIPVVRLNGRRVTPEGDGVYSFAGCKIKEGEQCVLTVEVEHGELTYYDQTVFTFRYADTIELAAICLLENAEVTLRAANSNLDAVRYLVYYHSGGDNLVLDQIGGASVTVSLPTGCELEFVATTMLTGEYSRQDWSNQPNHVEKRLTLGQSTTLVLPVFYGKDNLAEQLTVANRYGFSGANVVTWISDTEAVVTVRLQEYFREVSVGATNLSSTLLCPENIFDITVSGSKHTRTVEESNGHTAIRFVSEEERFFGENHSYTVSFHMNAEDLKSDELLSVVMNATYEGEELSIPIMNQYLDASPLNLYVPERLSAADAASGSLPVQVVCALENCESWTLTLYDDGTPVYCGQLPGWNTRLQLNVDSKLHSGKITAKISKGELEYSASCKYEVVDNHRPILTAAHIGSTDLLDIAQTSLSYGSAVTAEFTNIEKVKSVNLVVRSSGGDAYYPLKLQGGRYCLNSVGIAEEVFCVYLEWEEQTDKNTVRDELDMSSMEGMEFILPEGAAFEQIPEELGGTQERFETAMDKWEYYQQCLAANFFNSADFMYLFGEEGEWELPSYRTADGDYLTVRLEMDEDWLADGVKVLVDGEERFVNYALTETENGIRLEIGGFGEYLFPTGEQTEPTEGDAPAVVVMKKTIRGEDSYNNLNNKFEKGNKIKGVIDKIEKADDLLNNDLNTTDDKKQAIDDLLDELPYAPEVAKEALHDTVDNIENRYSEIDREMCAAGMTSYCKKKPENSGGGSGEGDSDEEEKKKEEENSKGNSPKKNNHPVMDPSGFIFEGTQSERLEGVTATIYQQIGERWYKWNSVLYGQPANPSVTGVDGAYGWDTLMGNWKVVFEKEGYYTAESEELAVPPEHLDVNISMVASTAPVVDSVLAYPDETGETRLRLAFDKPMTVDSVTAEGMVSVMLGTHKLNFEISALEPVQTQSGNKQSGKNAVCPDVWSAKGFYITTEDPVPAGAMLRVVLDGECMGYNLIALGENTEYLVEVQSAKPEIPVIGITPAQTEWVLKTGDTVDAAADLKLSTPDASETLEWISSDPAVATVDSDGVVTAHGAGFAEIIVRGVRASAVISVSVQRDLADPGTDTNKASFCREENLVVDKRCWLFSLTENEDMEMFINGDLRFIPTVWTISENGVETAGGTLAAGEESVMVPYYPRTPGASCTGTIDFKQQRYTDGVWMDTGLTSSASKTLPITTVTSISVRTMPRFHTGQRLDLQGLVLDVTLSDGSVSRVPYSKFVGYGISFSVAEGTVLTGDHTSLVITHTGTGVMASVPLVSDSDLLLRNLTCSGTTLRFDMDSEAERPVLLIAALKDGNRMVRVRTKTVTSANGSVTVDMGMNTEGYDCRVFAADPETLMPIVVQVAD